MDIAALLLISAPPFTTESSINKSSMEFSCRGVFSAPEKFLDRGVEAGLDVANEAETFLGDGFG